MRSDRVERRWYEIAIASRLEIKNKEAHVKSLGARTLYDNTPLGNFIYKRTKANFQKLVEAGSFDDESLKVKVAFSDFKEIKNKEKDA